MILKYQDYFKNTFEIVSESFRFIKKCFVDMIPTLESVRPLKTPSNTRYLKSQG